MPSSGDVRVRADLVHAADREGRASAVSAGIEAQARAELGEVREILHAALLDLLTTEGLDAERRLLDRFRALARRDDDLLEVNAPLLCHGGSVKANSGGAYQCDESPDA